MLKARIPLLIFRLLLLMAFSFFGVIACAEEIGIKKLPVAAQISFVYEGVVAKFDFEVDQHLIYNFAIRFRYPKGDQVERSRVRAIIGGYEVDKKNNPIEPGILTPIKLTIEKQRTGQPVYQKSITPILTSWGGDAYDKYSESFTKNIGHCDLLPGKYTVFLENLSARKEYQSIPTFLLIGMDKFKLLFDEKNIDRSKTCPQ